MAYAFGHLIGAWLLGLLIQKVKKIKLSRTAWGLLLIGGILPDIDLLSDWILGTQIHRTFTHSLIFALFIFGLAYLILKKYNREKQAIFISLGIIVHLALDSIYSPGPPIFWPWQYATAANGIVVNALDTLNRTVKLEYIDMGMGVLWTAYLFIKNKINF
ncbi:metal-dependent hydrolase [archaeon]|nr:metal-dependent hydrolase [archaeon]